MLVATRRVVRARALVLWSAATAGVGVLAAAVLPMLVTAPETLEARDRFAGTLTTGCAAATVVAAAWLWAITTEVVVKVLAAGVDGAGVVVRRPGGLRLLLLAACGVVALGSPAVADTPGHHDSPSFTTANLSGLPLPDRATGHADPKVSSPTAPPEVHQVRSGESLWTIAEQRLSPGAAVADVSRLVQRIYLRNATAIGPDPDLIVPGQALDIPPPG
ncbi:hypothetical protein F0U44_09875 [Nocardioides humilatus]|uniref:LysM domain-containing protein n=1 Tax=Nocardioides humilatus TaxID=2607660 RepID=A0A5B1LGJ5_9ACTN|nr:hypothetical protein [Nocardioides humilatus]KAA1418789.1 hypothetical protein F0U44_09875 [Nocardioides humilatus]